MIKETVPKIVLGVIALTYCIDWIQSDYTFLEFFRNLLFNVAPCYITCRYYESGHKF